MYRPTAEAEHALARRFAFIVFVAMHITPETTERKWHVSFKQHERISDVLSREQAGDEVTVGGWVRTRRDSKGFSFIEINDGSCFANMQIIADSSLPNYAEQVQKLTTGSSVTVTGLLAESVGKGQRFEIKAARVVVHSIAPSDYVLQKKRHGFELLREVAHLRPRTNTFGAVTRIRNSLTLSLIHI